MEGDGTGVEPPSSPFHLNFIGMDAESSGDALRIYYNTTLDCTPEPCARAVAVKGGRPTAPGVSSQTPTGRGDCARHCYLYLRTTT